MLIGVVGKPNVGKSTFFKALTLANVEIANYPFTTINPNKGFGHVSVNCADHFFNLQCNPRFGYCVNHKRFIPIEIIDVAGLVPGAHEGKGLGNKFLDDLRQADAFIHVIDCSGSTDEKGQAVEAGSYDPANDIKFLEHELDMWYLQIISKGWERFARTVYQEKQNITKALGKQLSGLKISEEEIAIALKELNLTENPLEWNEDDLLRIASSLRKKKKIIIAANKIDIEYAYEIFNRLKREFPNYTIICCSAESEVALKEAAKKNMIAYVPGESNFELIGNVNEKQKIALEFIRKNVLEKFGTTGVQQIINFIVFDALKQIAVYPVSNSRLTDKEGRILPDCFLVPEGTTALELAFKIHSTIGESFIKAIDHKTKQIIGKDYRLKNGDVIEIVSGK